MSRGIFSLELCSLMIETVNHTVNMPKCYKYTSAIQLLLVKIIGFLANLQGTFVNTRVSKLYQVAL